jgi:hypothetical protein
MQIVAHGAQDVYLTGNPQITFFKIVYRRYTNFAQESIEQPFSGGSVDFGRKVVCQVARNADLMYRTYLQVDLPALSQTTGTVAWARNIGHVLISDVNIEIGGQQIDKHYGDYMHIWNQLTQTAEKQDGFSVMVGNTTVLTEPSASIPATTLYIPFHFWFCENAGLALPLIALQYHDVKFNLTFNSAANCYITDDNAVPSSGTPVISNATIYIDYIYLDTDERRQFAQVQHEYLIEQLQYSGAESFSSTNVNPKLNLNHPVKELIWVFQLDSNVTNGANRWTDYTDSASNLANAFLGNDVLNTAKLQLNGQDRFSVRPAAYFNIVQPYQHHTACPPTGIYVYSFALHPEQHQPSGSVNMSRIDNAVLNFTLTTGSATGQFRLYARNNNVLRIMAGMGGLAYSN